MNIYVLENFVSFQTQHWLLFILGLSFAVLFVELFKIIEIHLVAVFHFIVFSAVVAASGLIGKLGVHSLFAVT